MNEKVKIGDHLIGAGEPTFIIAELGANHDNKLSQAFELIDIAAESGADAVKLQIYYGEELWPKNTRSCEILKSLETNREWIPQLQERADQKGIMLLATPFDKEAVDIFDGMDTNAFKWASSEIFDIPLLKYAAGKGRPMIIATGVTGLSDVEVAIDTVRQQGNEDVILLHCVSAYPTEPKDAHLRMIDTMRDAFHVPVGFSDHTLGITIPIAAVARGANVIEKHYTLSRKLEGPDHGFALEPIELKQLVEGIRDVEQSLGSPVKTPVSGAENEETIVRVFAVKDIKQGTVISEDMLAVKRANVGLKPDCFEFVVGRKAKGDIEALQPITWELI